LKESQRPCSGRD